MKQAFWGMFIFMLTTGSLWAGGPLPEASDNVLLNRLQLHQALTGGLEALPEDEMSSVPAKSVGKAVLFCVSKSDRIPHGNDAMFRVQENEPGYSNVKEMLA